MIKLIDKDEFNKNTAIFEEILRDIYHKNFDIDMELLKKKVVDKIKDLNSYLENDTAVLLGAYHNLSLIGFLWMYMISDNKTTKMHITQIGILPNYQGLGYGKLLMEKAEEQALFFNVKYIELYSKFDKKLIKFYTKNKYNIKQVKLEKKL